MSLAAEIPEPGLRAQARSIFFAALLFPATLSIATAAAQQVTGELGSPSATTTIDGKQLPPSAPPFGGVIKQSAVDSKAWWAPRIVPPKGAPNILLIMTDDHGYHGQARSLGGRSLPTQVRCLASRPVTLPVFWTETTPLPQTSLFQKAAQRE
jgi:hypothetical protein